MGLGVMQQRFHVSWHTNFGDAVEEKSNQERRNPKQSYQVRKRSGGRFALVQRVSAKEVILNPERVVKVRRQRPKHG